ncbi:MAG: XrtN system VIT domain-containing protein [Bacteroidota bacterium]
MKTLLNKILNDKTLFTGIIFIILSLVVFIIPELNSLKINNNAFLGVFFVNYCFIIIYIIVLLGKTFFQKWKFLNFKFEYATVLSILYLISAFSLNREIPIFEDSVLWVSIFLCIQCTSIILLSLLDENSSKLLKHILIGINGVGIVFYIYYTIYLTPFYLIGMIGGLFFGVGLHVFVPAFCVVLILLRVRKEYKINKQFIYSFVVGVLIASTATILFVSQWQKYSTKINYIINDQVANDNNLPLWVNLSQQIEKNHFTEKIFKSNLVYTVYNNNKFWQFGFPQELFDEVKKHDPLVMIASFFSNVPDISDKEKIKILESMYDSRHQAQERLWSGDMLQTSNVISNVKLFPEYRIAYTEKIISISNNDVKNNWNNEKEAIYTFYLPEGGVATSLSLWINGKEEKGILTTKSKADSAYKTIVGVESRDPSVVHWQEGNTLSVRVFPCTSKENRRFKLGITAPLKKYKNKLVYQNIYFDGPNSLNATESVQIQITKDVANIEFPFLFEEIKNNVYKAEKKYSPYWEINFDEVQLSKETFSFDNNTYSISNYSKTYESFNAQKIYLDINSSWTKTEMDEIWKAIKTKEVYVFQDEMIIVNNNNLKKLFEQLQKKNFSLFPFDKIEMPEKSLVISKSTSTSPNLKDIQESVFFEELKKQLQKNTQVRMFNFGDNLSPYLKSLKELRVFVYDEGSTKKLSDNILNSKFILNQENDSSIVIDNAEIIIRKELGNKNENAPDHLLRLYAYNNVLKTVSKNYFNNNFINDDVISEAELAYVVTPVSSLIVLETKQDYERFDIVASKNSLKNASIKSSGAVPEPHEWLLIIIAASIIIYLRFKPYFIKKAA